MIKSRFQSETMRIRFFSTSCYSSVDTRNVLSQQQQEEEEEEQQEEMLRER